MGCHYSPDDFSDLSFEGLKKEIDKGYISIDWWDYLEFEGKEYERGYFLRVRNEYAPIVDPSWGGVCILLTEDGCPLSFEERPKGARLLIPSVNKCKSLYTKEDCCIDWIKYHDILEELHDYYLGKIGSGLVKTCTANFFCLGWIKDLIQLAVGSYKDNAGAPLRK